MKQPEFSSAELPKIGRLGLTEGQARRQIDIFRKPCTYIRLNRLCTLADSMV
jgi:hypothetical protein